MFSLAKRLMRDRTSLPRGSTEILEDVKRLAQHRVSGIALSGVMKKRSETK
jgi:hypothetical protein